MTTYRDIATAEVDANSPVTTTLVAALADNPTAITEAASGSPVHQYAWHPYNMVNVSDGKNGKLWGHASDGSTSSVTTPVFQSGYEYRLFLRDVRVDGPGGSTSAIDVEFYKASDANYQRAGILNNGSSAPQEMISAVVEIFSPGMVKLAQVGVAHAAGQQGGSSFSETVGLGFYDNNNQAITRMRIRPTPDSSFVIGEVYLYRRKDPHFLA